ncbi:hypothetical protein SAMN05216486_11916 [bacterium JGI 053]|nr:hypothetical protein SAMN05216486_11916 [bacterium JGI 053]
MPAWLLWCIAISAGFLIGMIIGLLVDSVGEYRYAQMLLPSDVVSHPIRSTEQWTPTADGPPEGPPCIDVYV